MKVKAIRKIQEEVVKIFEREKIDPFEGYGILSELCDCWEKTLYDAEYIDVNKLKDSSLAIQETN